MSRNERPLFLVGSGRCGSTVLHEMLAHHEDLSYLTHALDKRPASPRTNARLMGLRDRPLLGRLLHWRVEPSEAWDFWEHWVPGFATPCRDLGPGDAGPRVQRRIRRALQEAMRSDDRLLVKFTGWPRLRWILEVFPDARIVHVVRDARAVANSMLAVDWWKGWGGPERWTFGPLGESESELWDAAGRDFAALAGLEWVRLVRAWHEAVAQLAPDLRESVLEIRYDEMCRDRDGTVRRILDFAGLESSPRFATRVGGYDLRNRDDKWEQDLSEESRRALEQVLEASNWRRYYPMEPTGAAEVPIPSSSR